MRWVFSKEKGIANTASCCLIRRAYVKLDFATIYA
jgi:hypothetical protein